MRFEKLVPKTVTERKTIKNTDIIVMGNAKENRLRVGAERVITPIATFISSKTTANGSIINAAALNMKPAELTPAWLITSVSGILPIGKNS